MSARRVSAVILAGGRSSRFGRDKLAEPVDGRPLLGHVIDGVRPLATEIVIVAAPGATLPLSGQDDVIVVHDPVAFEGPLAGLLTGLAAASEPVVLVVGGDMPTIVDAVVEAMLEVLNETGVGAVALENDGRARPLPMVLRRDTALAAADGLVGSGERRLGALPEALAARIVPEGVWRALDPDGLTLRDIDTQADLT